MNHVMVKKSGMAIIYPNTEKETRNQSDEIDISLTFFDEVKKRLLARVAEREKFGNYNISGGF